MLCLVPKVQTEQWLIDLELPIRGLDPPNYAGGKGWVRVNSLPEWQKEFKATLSILMRPSQNGLVVQDWVQAPASEMRDMTQNFYIMKKSNKLLKHFLNGKFIFMG